MAKTALITGAAGFVGRNMKRYLEDTGWLVTGTDIAFGTGGAPNYINRAESFDLVVHAAAAGANRKAIDTEVGNFSLNVMLDASIINWAMARGNRLVYLSSSAVYSDDVHELTNMPNENWVKFAEQFGFIGDPFDNYGETKRIGEKMVMAAQRAGLAAHIVRPFSGYGSDQSEDFPFRAFVERARRREDPFTIWGSAAQLRDWIHIDDIVRGIMAVVEHDVSRPVNLCTGVPTSMFAVAQLCAEAAGYDPEIAVDVDAPMGVRYRVGDPTFMKNFYEPKITIEEGVQRALKQR